jgi:hypothetical protein
MGMEKYEKFWMTTENYSKDGNGYLRNDERWTFCGETKCFFKQIQFECENVPEGYELMFVSNKRNLIDTFDGVHGVSLIMREIMKGYTGNRYAYFGKKFDTLTFEIVGI